MNPDQIKRELEKLDQQIEANQQAERIAHLNLIVSGILIVLSLISLLMALKIIPSF